MKYEKPEILVRRFCTEAYLEDDLISAGGDTSSIIDDTNLGDIGHEILDNIFNP